MSNVLLIGVVVVLTLDYALVRIPGWERRGVVYWFVQGVNTAAAGFLVFVGMPRSLNRLLAMMDRVHVGLREMDRNQMCARTEEDKDNHRGKSAMRTRARLDLFLDLSLSNAQLAGQRLLDFGRLVVGMLGPLSSRLGNPLQCGELCPPFHPVRFPVFPVRLHELLHPLRPVPQLPGESEDAK